MLIVKIYLNIWNMKVYQICKKLRNEGGHTWPCLIWASNILTDNLTDNASTDTRGESSLKLISAYFPTSVSTLKHKDHQPLASASLTNAFTTIVLYKYNIMHVQCRCCCCSELGHFALWLKAVTWSFALYFIAQPSISDEEVGQLQARSAI